MKEIIIQRCGYALKQGNVDIVLEENPVDMRSGAANIFRQLCGRYVLLSHYFLDLLPDVHEKAWNLFNLPNTGFPLPPYQQVIPRQNTLAFHNGFLIRCLNRDFVEIGVQEFVSEKLFYRIMCLCLLCYLMYISLIINIIYF